MSKVIKVLIVDDHPFFREGVKLYLSSTGGFEVVCSVSSGAQALEAMSNCMAEVVILDLHMPGMDGISTTQALLERHKALRVLILTSFHANDKIQQALAAGASGYCLKDAPPAELAAAIRAVAEGGTYLGRGISPQAFASPADSKSQCTNIPPILSELTDRELDVLRLITKGLGNKEIAEFLYVGEKTVKTHVANILQKLNVKTRTQAALLASKQGLCQEDNNA